MSSRRRARHIKLEHENESRKTMFEQFQILLYILPALLVTFIAFRKGKLNNPREKTLKVLTVVGVVLPWIDVIDRSDLAGHIDTISHFSKSENRFHCGHPTRTRVYIMHVQFRGTVLPFEREITGGLNRIMFLKS